MNFYGSFYGNYNADYYGAQGEPAPDQGGRVSGGNGGKGSRIRRIFRPYMQPHTRQESETLIEGLVFSFLLVNAGHTSVTVK